MHHLKSLREYIDHLRAVGEIQEIDAEVDWHLEMGAIIRRAGELGAAAPLFHRIKGIERGFRVLGAPAGVSRRYGLARVAISLGFPPSARAPEMVAALADAHRQTPLPPRRIADGPCKENKLLGADVDLWRLPAPLIHPGDGGRYLNTWGTVIVQTPDRRWTNWSISRIMVSGKNTMVGLVLPQQHLGMIFAEWQSLQQPMPFALAMGTAPAIPFVSGMPLEANVDEAGFLGGYLGEPVEVVDCETVALQVPATSEIVVEGTIAPAERVPEGPMGEYTGYLAPGSVAPNPVFHVSAMTFRNEPILPVVAAGEPIEENHTCWSLAISAQILWELRNKGLPVSMCFCPFESAVHWLVVTVNCSGTGVELARSVGEAVFGSRCGNFIPQIILLEDDIDPSNLAEVVWAFATRCHPVRDQVLFPDRATLPLVAYLSEDERRQARGMKVVWNGLSSEDIPTGQRPRRTSFRHLWPREIQERVLRRWTELGYPET